MKRTLDHKHYIDDIQGTLIQCKAFIIGIPCQCMILCWYLFNVIVTSKRLHKINAVIITSEQHRPLSVSCMTYSMTQNQHSPVYIKSLTSIQHKLNANIGKSVTFLSILHFLFTSILCNCNIHKLHDNNNIILTSDQCLLLNVSYMTFI